MSSQVEIVSVNSFNVTDVYLVGTRILFEDIFLSQTSLEEYRNLLDSISIETFGGDPSPLLVRDPSAKYTQNLPMLYKFAGFLQASPDYSNVRLVRERSPIGLPWTLKYTYDRHRTDIVFDGTMFVSRRLVATGEMPIEAYLHYAEYDGSVHLNSMEFPSLNNTEFSSLEFRCSAMTDWRYCTRSADLSSIVKRLKPTFQMHELVLRERLVDHRVIRAVYPTGEGSSGKEFEVYVGAVETVEDLISNQSELLRSLSQMQEWTQGQGRKISRELRKITHLPAPLPDLKDFGILKPNNWGKTLHHWSLLHRNLESSIQLDQDSRLAQQILDCYTRIGDTNVSYRILESPIRVNEDSARFSRYPTLPPMPFKIEIVGEEVYLKLYQPKSDDYGIGNWSKQIFETNSNLIEYNKETLDIIKNLSVTAQAVVTTVGLAVAVLALLISAFISILAALTPLIF